MLSCHGGRGPIDNLFIPWRTYI